MKCNLGAQSFVGASWNQPVLTAEVSGIGGDQTAGKPSACSTRNPFLSGSTSEMFGLIQAEATKRKHAVLPAARMAWPSCMATGSRVNYRESFNLHASSGILFNHESPLRGIEFVTVKSPTPWRASSLRASKKNCAWAISTPSATGALPATTWKPMWLDAATGHLDDYVVATGVTTTVRDMVNIAFAHVGLKAEDHLID